MELKVTNKNEVRKLTVIAAIVGFVVCFIAAGAVMKTVFGLKPGDEGYATYGDGRGNLNTPYQDFIANGCMTKQHFNTDETVVMDTKGLKELGLIWFDPNTCFDIAKTMTNEYNIDSIETDPVTDDMKITLVKK